MFAFCLPASLCQFVYLSIVYSCFLLDVQPTQSSSSQSQPFNDSHRSISVPVHIDRLKNSPEGQRLNEGNSKRGSHPDLFIASSGSDFELAYEKAGLRLKEKSPVAADTTVVAGKFKLGSLSDSSEEKDQDVDKRPGDDNEETPLPQEEPDPALKEAVHRLAKAIQLSESVSEKDTTLPLFLCIFAFILHLTCCVVFIYLLKFAA